MPRNLTTRTQDVNAVKESVGAALQDYARVKDRTEAAAVRDQVLRLVGEATRTPEGATQSYRTTCERLVAEAIKVRGMPVRTVIGEGGNHVLQSCSGPWVSEHFEELLPMIRQRLDWAVQNYLAQAETFHANRPTEFLALLDAFLEDPPRLAKETGSRITPIKREAGYYARWDENLYALKANSFPAEMAFVFEYHRGDAIAARWEYSDLDERMDDIPASDHRLRDGAIYTVKNNWALRKGLMTPGAAGYIEDLDIPSIQLGCACSLVWITSLRKLPDDMLTEAGRLWVQQPREGSARALVAAEKRSLGNWLSRLLHRIFIKR